MRKDQFEFGKQVIEEAKKAIADVGWEQTAFAAMFANMNAAAAFTKHIPEAGRVGCKVITDKKFFEHYQEMIGSLALMAAVMAEKTGMDLKAGLEAANRPN